MGNVNNIDFYVQDLEKLKGNAILKTRKFGYDGKGQHIIKKYRITNIKDNIEKNKYIIEGIIKFKKEISVIITRYGVDSYEIYEPIENVHENQILKYSKKLSGIPKF